MDNAAAATATPVKVAASSTAGSWRSQVEMATTHAPSDGPSRKAAGTSVASAGTRTALAKSSTHPSDAARTRKPVTDGVEPARTNEMARTPAAMLAHASAAPDSRGTAAFLASRTYV